MIVLCDRLRKEVTHWMRKTTTSRHMFKISNHCFLLLYTHQWCHLVAKRKQCKDVVGQDGTSCLGQVGEHIFARYLWTVLLLQPSSLLCLGGMRSMATDLNIMIGVSDTLKSQPLKNSIPSLCHFKLLFALKQSMKNKFVWSIRALTNYWALSSR